LAVSDWSVFSIANVKFFTLYNFVEEPCNDALNYALVNESGILTSVNTDLPGLHSIDTGKLRSDPLPVPSSP